MLEARRIIVRPRVILPGSQDALLLEDEVRERIENKRPGFIELCGPPGSGKTTAIEYLSRTFIAERFLVAVDGPDVLRTRDLLWSAQTRLVVCAAAPFRILASQGTRWLLAGWSSDELLEYLSLAHPAQRSSVWLRIQADAERDWLGTLPELWQLAIDRLSANESLPNARSALRAGIHRLLISDDDLSAARQYCFTCRLRNAIVPSIPVFAVQGEKTNNRLRTLLRHPQVWAVLGAEYVAEQLHRYPAPQVLTVVMPLDILQDVAAEIDQDHKVLENLQQILKNSPATMHPTVASILHAAGALRLPRSSRELHLRGAHLPGVIWPRARVKNLDISEADLSGADLRESRLGKVIALGARLSAVRLHGAKIKSLEAAMTDLSRADLSFIRARAASFRSADLSGADLEGALLRNADFTAAYLQEARLCRADLSYSKFLGSTLTGADFSGASLRHADMSDLVLRDAQFSGAIFNGATLFECDLEQVQLPGANFAEAHLDGSYLSASHMPGANFPYAGLRSTGLADVHWERADLRDADLRGATFHLGSSRSGLVGSPIACEGSRTGFYTDEYHDQDFRAPEEIRKANLRGADLRGALLEGVDFYLVDLREARYTPDQEEYFRHCKAILEARV